MDWRPYSESDRYVRALAGGAENSGPVDVLRAHHLDFWRDRR